MYKLTQNSKICSCNEKEEKINGETEKVERTKTKPKVKLQI